LIFFLNTCVLYNKALHCAKSIPENIENPIEIVGLGEKVWGLATILGEWLEANLLQWKRGKRGTLLLHTSWKEHRQPHFLFPSCK
jgi:hypothetical protein